MFKAKVLERIVMVIYLKLYFEQIGFLDFGFRMDYESGSVVRSVSRMGDVTKKPRKINK